MPPKESPWILHASVNDMDYVQNLIGQHLMTNNPTGLPDTAEKAFNRFVTPLYLAFVRLRTEGLKTTTIKDLIKAMVPYSFYLSTLDPNANKIIEENVGTVTIFSGIIIDLDAVSKLLLESESAIEKSENVENRRGLVLLSSFAQELLSSHSDSVCEHIFWLAVLGITFSVQYYHVCSNVVWKILENFKPEQIETLLFMALAMATNSEDTEKQVTAMVNQILTSLPPDETIQATNATSSSENHQQTNPILYAFLTDSQKMVQQMPTPVLAKGISVPYRSREKLPPHYYAAFDNLYEKTGGRPSNIEIMTLVLNFNGMVSFKRVNTYFKNRRSREKKERENKQLLADSETSGSSPSEVMSTSSANFEDVPASAINELNKFNLFFPSVNQ